MRGEHFVLSIESQKNPNFTVRSGFNYRTVDAECMFLEDEGEVEGRGGAGGGVGGEG